MEAPGLGLEVMDNTAPTMFMDDNTPIVVFDVNDADNLNRPWSTGLP